MQELTKSLTNLGYTTDVIVDWCLEHYPVKRPRESRFMKGTFFCNNRLQGREGWIWGGDTQRAFIKDLSNIIHRPQWSGVWTTESEGVIAWVAHDQYHVDLHRFEKWLVRFVAHKMSIGEVPESGETYLDLAREWVNSLTILKELSG